MCKKLSEIYSLNEKYFIENIVKIQNFNCGILKHCEIKVPYSDLKFYRYLNQN